MIVVLGLKDHITDKLLGGMTNEFLRAISWNFIETLGTIYLIRAC